MIVGPWPGRHADFGQGLLVLVASSYRFTAKAMGSLTGNLRGDLTRILRDNLPFSLYVRMRQA